MPNAAAWRGDRTICHQPQPFAKMVRRGDDCGYRLFITGLSLYVGGIDHNIRFVSEASAPRDWDRQPLRKRHHLTIPAGSASICLIEADRRCDCWLLTLPSPFHAVRSITVVLIALLVSLVTGLLSGFFPAWRAARMNPVDALRNE